MSPHKSKQQYANEMEHTAVNFLKFFGMGILGAGFIIGVGFLVRFLWNTLVTDIFGLKEITYWQSVGLLLLAKIIFGFGGGGSSSSPKSKEKDHRGLIASEIHQAMQKEFKEEYAEKYKDSAPETSIDDTVDVLVGRENNHNQDALYEKWWSEEGEQHFKSFLNKEDKG